jgi:hypothetical protein
VVVNDEPAPEPVEEAAPDDTEPEPDEPPKLTYKTTVIPSSGGNGESEVVIVMAVAADQGAIDWSKGFSLNNLISGAVFKDIISTIKAKVDPPKKVVWRIASQPRRAEVIDVRKGEVIGKTPVRIEFNENKDIQATYKVRAAGHDDTIIELSGAENYDKTVTLARKITVAIKSKPEGAAIVDAKGTALGVTPAELTLSRSEQPVAFTLKFEGYDDRAGQAAGHGQPSHRLRAPGRHGVQRQQGRDRGDAFRGQVPRGLGSGEVLFGAGSTPERDCAPGR